MLAAGIPCCQRWSRCHREPAFPTVMGRASSSVRNMFLCWVFLLLASLCTLVQNVAIPTDEQRLMQELLADYDPASRPVYNASHTVVVKFGITLTQLSDMVLDFHADYSFERRRHRRHHIEHRRTPDEQRLLSRLLANYDTASRPVYNASHAVVVKFGFTLTQIADMDEVNQVLTTNVWIEQEWNDERLRWKPEDYNGLEKVRIPCEKIWLPDIVLYNSADDFTTGYMQSKAMVSSDGTVFWPPPAKLRSSCKIDITYFPFDDQMCKMKFGSWIYDGFQVDVTNRSADVDLTNYVYSGEWDLLNIKPTGILVATRFGRKNHTWNNGLTGIFCVYVANSREYAGHLGVRATHRHLLDGDNGYDVVVNNSDCICTSTPSRWATAKARGQMVEVTEFQFSRTTCVHLNTRPARTLAEYSDK
ncbi:neuronal acetylcholine receptor subunit alpha-10-like isoform X1 [Octopus vulgaris]|uniref:Neuronal acetylcholine receptor subunit alpha-10-like isoform X1 n=1 Tax=Octopus vulgaris TaxID=6645 RepID=A0AA36F0P2_OCTVU|nr:neuronal acetylcholine receptor subunit alpha-10-like isoform X1 [Octopus vulgaris]